MEQKKNENQTLAPINLNILPNEPLRQPIQPIIQGFSVPNNTVPIQPKQGLQTINPIMMGFNEMQRQPMNVKQIPQMSQRIQQPIHNQQLQMPRQNMNQQRRPMNQTQPMTQQSMGSPIEFRGHGGNFVEKSFKPSQKPTFGEGSVWVPTKKRTGSPNSNVSSDKKNKKYMKLMIIKMMKM